MMLRRWIRRVGDLLVVASYALLLGHTLTQQPPAETPTGPVSVSDPSFWTKDDLIGLLSFCSRDNPWPRPAIVDSTENHTVIRAVNPLPRLHYTYKIANKAWSNKPNGQKRTAFTTEEVILLDGFDTSASKVSSFVDSNNGTLVLGYLSVGSFEDWRSDAGKWPGECIGKEYDGWAGENWLRVDKWQLIKPVMLARLKMLRDKGFHGFEGDNIGLLDQFSDKKQRDKYKQHAIRYARWLADTAHGLGLLAVFKNGPYLVDAIADYFDAIIIESALKYNELDQYALFAKKKKPVWLFEYDGSSDNLVQKLKRTNLRVSDVQLETGKGWKRVI